MPESGTTASGYRIFITLVFVFHPGCTKHQCQPSTNCSVTCLMLAGIILILLNPQRRLSSEEKILCIVRLSSFCSGNISEFSRLPGQLSWAGKARDFTVKSVDIQCHGDTKSGLFFQWKPPLDGLRQLKGFRLLVTAQNGQFRDRSFCRILDLRNASWTVHHVDNVFSYNMYPLPDNTQFSINLVSLPTPEVRHQAEMSYILTASTPPRGPSVWTTHIDWFLDDRNNINVTFDPAPIAYDFREYDVILMEVVSFEGYHNSLTVDNKTSSEKLWTVFYNVSEGEYEIKMRPIGGECQNDCKTSRNNSVIVKALTEQLVSTVILPTPEILQKAPNNYLLNAYTSPTVAPASGSSHDVNMSAIGYTFGVAVVLALSLMTAIYVIRRKRGAVGPNCPYFWKTVQVPHDRQKSVTLDSEQLLPLRRKTVFLLYSADHEAFVSLVSAFARYLQTFCFLEVLHIDWCFSDLRSDGIQSWISKGLNRADVTVVIHSTGATKQFSAWMDGIQFKSVKSTLKGCLFANALSVLLASPSLRQTCVDVTFQNDNPKNMFSFEGHSRVFNLMREFRDFLLHIHKLEDNGKTYDLPLNAVESETEEGRQLLQSILETNLFEQHNPKWFESMFSGQEPVGDLDQYVSHNSSGYCSQDQCQFVEPDVITDCEDDDISINEQLRNINVDCFHH